MKCLFLITNLTHNTIIQKLNEVKKYIEGSVDQKNPKKKPKQQNNNNRNNNKKHSLPQVKTRTPKSI